jgi:hypothetical protein
MCFRSILSFLPVSDSKSPALFFRLVGFHVYQRWEDPEQMALPFLNANPVPGERIEREMSNYEMLKGNRGAGKV